MGSPEASVAVPSVVGVAAWPRRVAWAAFALTVVATTVSLWILFRYERLPLAYGLGEAAIGATAIWGVTVGMVGLIVAPRHPRNPIGWLLVGTGVIAGIGSLITVWPATVLASRHDDLAVALGLLSGVNLRSGFILLAPVVLVLFPDGRVPTTTGAWAIGLAVVAAVVQAVALLFGPTEIRMIPSVPDPYAWSGTMGDLVRALAPMGVLLGTVALVIAVTVAVGRYRVAHGDERRQLLWFAWASVLALAGSLPALVLWGFADPLDTRWGEVLGVLLMGSLMLVPIAIGIAIQRYRLYEIDRIINRTVLYGALTAILAGLIAALSTLTERLFTNVSGERSDLAVVAIALVVTASYTPLRHWLERVVDARFRWERRFGPLRDRFTDALETTDPTAALTRLVTDAVRELDAAWGRATLAGGGVGSVVVAVGMPATDPALSIAVVAEGRDRATIELGPTRDGDPYRATVVEDLRSVADLLGRTVRWRD
jgi:hypothetical protein